MPKLLRFEGATPEQARTKARAALGDDVLIVRAGRQRSGGVLGFFEHEVYILEVDPGPEAPPDVAQIAPLTPPRGAASGEAATPLARLPKAPAARHELPVPLDRGPAGPLDRLVDGVEDALELSGAHPAAEPPLASRAFSELLEEAEATVAAARSTADPDASLPSDDVAVQASPAMRPARVPERQPSSPEQQMRQLLGELGLPDAFLPTQGPIDTGLVDRLRRLPVPPPLPDAPDSVVLVAGPPDHLSPLVLSLARQLGVGPEGVVAVLARPRGLPDAAIAAGSAREAAALVAERRIARRPTVVAVGCRPNGPLPRLLGQVAAALRPDAGWAVLPARTDPEQLGDLVEAMRGLDACCLVELDRAPRPAALLASGCPVAALDWRIATPLMWAARLIDRCASEGATEGGSDGGESCAASRETLRRGLGGWIAERPDGATAARFTAGGAAFGNGNGERS